MRINPYLGYGWQGQSFSIRDPDGLYSFLNSRYATQWKGPLLKLFTDGNLGKRWEWDITVNYHQIKFDAPADWNLIGTFAHPVSFRQWADGYCLEAEGGIRYRIGRQIHLRIGGGYFIWQTGKGIDQLYLSSGGADQTQLNGVDRTGRHAELALAIGIGK